MTTETKLAEDMGLYSNPKLDEACKDLFKHKPILARILKECVLEYKDCSISEIEDCIQDAEKNIPLFSSRGGTKIEGQSTESGGRHFDIRFNALCPDGNGYTKILLNLEIQNKYATGYSLVTRGIFYAARMISDQDGVEFHKQEYKKLKKVYSIWISTWPAVGLHNCINRYKMDEEQLVGEMVLAKEEYDKIVVILINLGGMDEAKGGILRMLEVLLSNERSLSERKNILEGEFKIPMNEKIEEGLEQMCNYSTGVYLTGQAKGDFEATLRSVRNVMASLNCDVYRAMEVLRIPQEEKAKYCKTILEEVIE